ncbi:MAG TPA: thrombospondin type 3 repeat-containing protein [bacterium]|nr:thrombospondin type 3 repeat-containing protein [bacterium]HPW05466.1 thrombospondin type 3 repeat-containing protein [bacterium]HQO11022.1 thrombospondin type 3 repeat-containing protein [bacterium]HQQ37972.1 thrombospondin type 3 repeat-containing protein [bacterium]
MFNDLNKQVPASNAVDDIFAETESTVRSSEQKVNIEAQSAGLSAPFAGEDKSGDNSSGVKIKFILIIILALVILAAAAYLVYAKITRNAADQALDSPVLNNNVAPIVKTDNSVGTVVMPEVQSPEVNATATTSDISPVVTPNIISATETPVAVTAPVDSDGDSLTDAEETILGTNINLIDSDFDGLSDYEELRVYGTNPLNPDTDGDSYHDGDEVKNGYNPKGVGAL